MKRRIELISAALLTAMFASVVANADDLRGRISDPDQRAVPRAQVRLFDRVTGEIRTTLSSTEGNFEFRAIPSGDYLLEGSAASAALNASKQITVSGDATENLRLTMSATSSSVSVTANTIPLSVEETGKAIDVIDGQDIALRNEFLLAEAVRSLPGLQVRVLEGPGSFTTIQTRGLRSQDTAVLIDGMRFRDVGAPQGDSAGFLQDMILVDPDRIEFLRGSGSSLYGSHALGGVLNVSSRSGGGPTHGQVRLEGGGLGIGRGVATMSGGAAANRLTYSGGVSHLYMTKGVREGLPYRNNSAQSAAGFGFSPNLQVHGRMWYSNNYATSSESTAFTSAVLANSSPNTEVKAIPLALDQLKLYEKGNPISVGNATFIPNAINPDGRRRGRFFNGALGLQHQATPGTSLRAGYQVVDTKRTYLDGPAGPGFFFSDNSSYEGAIDTFQTRLDQSAGRHNLISFGYELENEQYRSFDGPDPESSNPLTNRIVLQQRSHALFVQDQIHMVDRRLQITLAGRAQFFDLKAPQFQGSTNPYTSVVSTVEPPTAYTGDGAVAYFMSRSRTKLRAHVGNSFRAPTSYERFGGGFGAFYGDPGLAPERSIAVDGGIDQWFSGSRAQISATWFYTRLQEQILYRNFFAAGTDPFNRIFGGYANGGSGIARGIELSGNVSPTTSTKLRASYTYANSDSGSPTIPGTDYHKRLDISPHTYTFGATQWIRQRTNVTFDMSAASDYIRTFFGSGTRRLRFDGPVKADIMVRHDLDLRDRTLEVYAKVENVFAQRPYEGGSVGPRAWFIAGGRILF